MNEAPRPTSRYDVATALPALSWLTRCYTTDADLAEQLVSDALIEAIVASSHPQQGEDIFCWLVSVFRTSVCTAAIPPTAVEKPAWDAAHAALLALPLEVREAVALHEVGLSDEQIARVCGYSIGRAVELQKLGHKFMAGDGDDWTATD